MKKLVIISLAVFMLALFNKKVVAQSVEVKLKTSDTTSAFTINDSSGKSLFNVKGDGTVKYKGSSWMSSEGHAYISGRTGFYPENGGNVYLSGGHTIMGVGSFYYPGEISIYGAHRNDSYSEIGGDIDIIAGGSEQKGGSINIKSGQGTIAGDINIISGYGRGGSSNGNIKLITGANPSGPYSSYGDIRLLSAGGIIINPNITSSFDYLSVRVNGSGTYTGTWAQVADKRFLKNISPMENSLGNVLKLTPIKYNWDNENYPKQNFRSKEALGLVAEELEKIYPELVITDMDGIKAIDYGKLSVVLLAAIKEQQKEIDELKKLINKN